MKITQRRLNVQSGQCKWIVSASIAPCDQGYWKGGPGKLGGSLRWFQRSSENGKDLTLGCAYESYETKEITRSTEISIMGTYPNLHLGAGGLSQTVWLRGRSGRGRDLKDEHWTNWRRDVVLRSTEAKEGRRSCHGRFRSGVGFRYIDFSQMVTNDLTKLLDYEISMILFGWICYA